MVTWNGQPVAASLPCMVRFQHDAQSDSAGDLGHTQRRELLPVQLFLPAGSNNKGHGSSLSTEDTSIFDLDSTLGVWVAPLRRYSHFTPWRMPDTWRSRCSFAFRREGNLLSLQSAPRSLSWCCPRLPSRVATRYASVRHVSTAQSHKPVCFTTTWAEAPYPSAIERIGNLHPRDNNCGTRIIGRGWHFLPAPLMPNRSFAARVPANVSAASRCLTGPGVRVVRYCNSRTLLAWLTA